MSFGSPMPNPSAKVYIISALIAAIALIIAALIGRSSGTSTAQDRASTTVAAQQATIDALRAQLSGPTQAALIPTVGNDTEATEATKIPTVLPSAPPTREPPASTPTPEPPPTIAPSPTPECNPGCVLYEANWQEGNGGWALSTEWQALNGMLISKGDPYEHSMIYAPASLDNISDYAVEAKIQVLKTTNQYQSNFGVGSRVTNAGGIWGVMSYQYCGNGANALLAAGDQGCGALRTPFEVDNNEHTYRLEVKGNTMKFYIDGGLVLDGKDNRFLDGGKAGISSLGMQMEVHSFKVIKL
jgi:hypothetical protein